MAGVPRIRWDVDGLYHVLHFFRRSRGEGGDDEGHCEVDEHANESDTCRADAEEELVFRTIEELEVYDVSNGEADSTDHTCDRSFFVDAL